MQGEVLEYGSLSEDLYIRLVLDGKRIVGANILDNYRVSGIIKNYMLRLFAGEQFVLPDYQRAMLVKAGLSVPFIDEVEEKDSWIFRRLKKARYREPENRALKKRIRSVLSVLRQLPTAVYALM